jgi:hypothetical protein
VPFQQVNRELKERKRLGRFWKLLNGMANELLKYYDEENCLSKQKFRRIEFQCKSHEEHVIASYHGGDYAHLGMKEVEQFVTFMEAHELNTFTNEHKTFPECFSCEIVVTHILYICIVEFSENSHVVDFNKRNKAA